MMAAVLGDLDVDVWKEEYAPIKLIRDADYGR